MWFDAFAKNVLRVLLRPYGQVETEREILGHVQSADVWVAPADGPGKEHTKAPSELGILARMLDLGACLVEPFSQTPRARDIRACVCKQYSLDHEQTRDAVREKRTLEPFPRLWLISPGRPERFLDEAEFRAMAHWPAGLYQRARWDACHLVVTAELPRTKATLPLRLLGRGATLNEAIAELVSLPEESVTRQRLIPVVVAFRGEIPHDALETDIMNSLQELDAIYEKWERRVKDEGRAEGRAEGQRSMLRSMLLDQLGQRFGPLPDAIRARIEAAEVQELQRWGKRVIPARSLAEVFE